MTTINIGSGLSSTTAPKITVNLVGVKYTVTPPKQMLNLRLARMAPALTRMADVKDLSGDADVEQIQEALAPIAELQDLLDAWIDAAFTPKDAPKVKARLQDGRDLLDLQHIMELVQAVGEAASTVSGEARPTT